MSSSGRNSLSGSSQPSSSVPPAPESSEERKVIAKLPVSVTSSGAIVGTNSEKWASRRGDFIRTHVPINFTDWRQVPQNFKDDVWNALMGEFEFDVDPKLARPLIQRNWNQAFRTFKNTLRGLLKKDAFEGEPKDIDPNVWRMFLENESHPKKKAQLKQNAMNRATTGGIHCLGRNSYAQKNHKMEKKSPGIVIKREDAWLKAREHSNGTVLEAAKEKVEEVKAAQNKRKGKAKVGEECDDIIVDDLNSDVLSEVFGKEPKGGIRGVSSHITKKQAILLGVAESKIQESKKAAKQCQDVMFSQLESQITTFVEGLLLSITSRLPSVSTPALVSTPPTDIGSNSVQPPNQISQNLNSVFGTMDAASPSPIHHPIDSPRVIINNKFGKVLAKGHVVTDATTNICHFKEVKKGEKKVYIEEVVDPDAPLWNAPQGGHHTFAEFVEGGYVIWLDMWMTYI